MKTLICVPAMDQVQTLFLTSLLDLKKPEGTEVCISSSSLVYDARNKLADKAITGGFDRVLWLDSDMYFAPDLLERFNEHLDNGLEFVCGLFFTRKWPIKPCVYSRCELVEQNGVFVPTIEPAEYKNELIEVAACGFGAVAMTTDVLRRVAARDFAFSPLPGFGEDFSFCLRAREQGVHIYCDPTIKVGHVGVSIINEETYLECKGMAQP